MSKKFLIRLDDASDYMDNRKWNRVITLLQNYDIKPIIGIIPDNQDKKMTGSYARNNDFWNKIKELCNNKGWVPALHGYHHVFLTNNGGINPVNFRSEFAGIPLEDQKRMIENGYNILISHGIKPTIFFAPAHTYDKNTLLAIKETTPIRIISDTIANDIYYNDDFFFVPQQSGKCRNLPLKLSTFCYHPNQMTNNDFAYLEEFVRRFRKNFTSFDDLILIKRKKSIYDRLLSKLYFFRRKPRS